MKRISYLDVLRTIATYFVIALHCISAHIVRADIFGTRVWWGCDIINAFARIGVPTFLMISGFLVLSDPRTLNVKFFYKRRFTRILVPFIVWDIIYYISNTLQLGSSFSVYEFFSQLLTEGSKYHLWYIYEIIMLYLFAPFLKRIVDAASVKAQWLLLLLITLPTAILPFLNLIQTVFLPWSIYIHPFEPIIDGYAGFFLAGYILGNMKSTPKLLPVISLVAGLAISIVGNYKASSESAVALLFNSGFGLTQYLTSCGFFVIIRNLYRNPGRVREAVGNVAGKIAPVTFGIYFAHVMVLEYLCDTGLASGVNIVRCFLVTSAVTTVGALIVYRIKPLRKILF